MQESTVESRRVVAVEVLLFVVMSASTHPENVQTKRSLKHFIVSI